LRDHATDSERDPDHQSEIGVQMGLDIPAAPEKSCLTLSATITACKATPGLKFEGHGQTSADRSVGAGRGADNPNNRD